MFFVKMTQFFAAAYNIQHTVGLILAIPNTTVYDRSYCFRLHLQTFAALLYLIFSSSG